MPVPAEFVESVATALGAGVTSVGRLGGGDFAEACRLTLDDGRVVFAKTHRDPPAGFFSTEAAGLDWLRSAGAAHVAAVLAVSDDAPAHLVLEWIEEQRDRRPDEGTFGRQLAQLHRSGAPSFGRADRRTTGSLALPNEPAATWAEFFASQRLVPLARRAAECGALADTAIRDLRLVADRLAEFGAADEPPARLHGDLWAGNRMVDGEGRSWLIDPAAHGGHREFDLAMMRLFGGFGAECFVAYDEAYPLADGWEERVALHQLAPLTVHAIKFGGGYVDATERALADLLAE